MNVAETNDPVGLHTLEVVANAGRFNHWMYEEFRHFLKGEVLEIGSGIGNISKLVIEDGHFITFSDYNSEYCSRLRQIFLGNKNVRDIIQLDLLKNGFEQQYAEFHEKFDSIFLLNVIEHIKDDALALKNCRFLLKPGGHLIVLAPAMSWLYCRFDRQLGHYRRYSLKKMKRLLGEENFTVRSASYFNFTGIAGWLLFGKILRRKMLGNSEMSVFDRIVPIAKRLDKLIGKRAGLSIIVTAVKS
jgi:SAM-dependent methyltransferase